MNGTWPNLLQRTQRGMDDGHSLDAHSVISSYTSAVSPISTMSMVPYGVLDYIFEEQLGDLLTSTNLRPTTFAHFAWNPSTLDMVTWKFSGFA